MYKSQDKMDREAFCDALDNLLAARYGAEVLFCLNISFLNGDEGMVACVCNDDKDFAISVMKETILNIEASEASNE